jgi:tRNA pseudouridine55 synthase
VNKPEGLTSFDVIRKLRKVMPKRIKMGHLGTLDPQARGVLPIAIGKATRLIPYIEDSSKEYIAEMTLGGISDTYDAWGNICYTGKTSFNHDTLNEVLDSFRGRIKQVPPMYSAVHYQGRRLYELARAGKSVRIPEREVEIFLIKLLSVASEGKYPRIRLEVHCSKGTYIRSLCHDIGQRLGTGGFLSSLVRTRAGAFCLSEAWSLDTLLLGEKSVDDFLLPMDYPLADMADYRLPSHEEVLAMLNGRALVINSNHLSPGRVKVWSPGNKLVAIAVIENSVPHGLVKPEKILVSNSDET